MNLTYSEALVAVKEGKLITRTGWAAQGMFVFMRPADELDIDFIVHKVKSLPQAVKNYYACLTNPDIKNGIDGETQIKFTPYLCLKSADNSIVNGWLPSQTDMLANDWYLAHYYIA